jgi:hypothetical protein
MSNKQQAKKGELKKVSGGNSGTGNINSDSSSTSKGSVNPKPVGNPASKPTIWPGP